MKTIYTLLCLLVFISLSAQNNLHVMTFNIRLNTPADSLNAWPYRKEKVASQILFHQSHIVGVQEALHNQMVDLKNLLPSYKYAGVGRDDGKQKGEYSAIFYDTLRLQLLRTETFWLSEQPNVPGSKSWDAAITRIVTWAQFIDRKTKKKLYVFNTHFDHIGQEARKESARLLLQKIKDIAGKQPVILTGDFNSQPHSAPIQIITDTTAPFFMTDTKKLSRQPHYGPTGTFNGFGPKEVDDEPIDFIFVRNGFKVLQHASLSQTWQGRFSSDHFPVFAIFEVN
ncbi:endonuclease/exonuclease/phosphatase family protein [Chitinophagaceae bacterium LB-8]|uniref:Endonuclease/exonuclease/phosphatase family protein n=1 Tax=Paraflavisolibacter caeni TaxID=2982496 RepID=A0A9X3BA89_9BACT|nr:endonuclease/exonuclease/phosphatase family protein [Paraflavisolibacter caeni]MCU7552366.1 endonuclease/exonuclease/phosphatase family protein [Paraflavisolibacter caeni]